MTTGLYIARGQPPHKGHLHVIKNIIQHECDDLIIAVGSAEQGYTKRNPLYGGERVRIFNRLLEQELYKPFSVHSLPDINNRGKYARYVEALLPPFDVVYANKETAPLFEKLGYKGRMIDVRFQNLSATSIRERIANNDLSWISDVHPVVYEELVRMDAIKRIKKIMLDEIAEGEPVVYRNPILTVDVIVKYQEGIILIERGKYPFQGMHALPGGHVNSGETLEAAAEREIYEETGLTLTTLKQFKSYSYPQRDPRGHYVSQVFTAQGHGQLRAGDDASKAEKFSLDELPELAFDHNLILEEYKQTLE